MNKSNSIVSQKVIKSKAFYWAFHKIFYVYIDRILLSAFSAALHPPTVISTKGAQVCPLTSFRPKRGGAADERSGEIPQTKLRLRSCRFLHAFAVAHLVEMTVNLAPKVYPLLVILSEARRAFLPDVRSRARRRSRRRSAEGTPSGVSAAGSCLITTRQDTFDYARRILLLAPLSMTRHCRVYRREHRHISSREA